MVHTPAGAAGVAGAWFIRTAKICMKLRFYRCCFTPLAVPASCFLAVIDSLWFCVYWFYVKSNVLHRKVYTWVATLCGVGSARRQEEEPKILETFFLASLGTVLKKVNQTRSVSCTVCPWCLHAMYTVQSVCSHAVWF